MLLWLDILWCVPFQVEARDGGTVTSIGFVLTGRRPYFRFMFDGRERRQIAWIGHQVEAIERGLAEKPLPAGMK